MSKKLNKKGFTLIEVVLVLAIGGLIFLLAFLAYQQVATNRRDTQRRNDAGRIVAEIANYSGDNQNVIPTASVGVSGATAAKPTFNYFLNTYMKGAEFKDPEGNTYESVDATNFAATSSKPNYILYTPGTTCSGASGSKNYKLEVKLEKGIACRDSGS